MELGEHIEGELTVEGVLLRQKISAAENDAEFLEVREEVEYVKRMGDDGQGGEAFAQLLRELLQREGGAFGAASMTVAAPIETPCSTIFVSLPSLSAR